MPVFKDATGKEWIVNLNVRKVKILRELGVDIMAADASGIHKLADDVVVLCDCLYRVCVENEELTQDQFFDNLHGDSIEAAATAMIDAVIDFFPQSRQRILKKAITKSRALQEKLLAEAEKEMDQDQE